MSDRSARLNLSFLLSNQAQKRVTMNEAFRRLTMLMQASVKSEGLTIEPDAPSNDDQYVRQPCRKMSVRNSPRIPLTQFRSR
jgi:hypothetical protein